MKYFVILTIALFLFTLINTEAFAGIPLERVPIISFDAYSLEGEKINMTMAGQQVNFVANITNMLENNQSFVYGVWLEENGTRTPIGLIESSLGPNQLSSYFIEWTPSKAGNYVVEGSVWESMESFTAFSAVWQAMVEVISSTSIKNPDYLENSKIENIDGNLFRVIGTFHTMPESNKIHRFEGVEFSNPYYPVDPIPPGGVFSVDITFDDGIKESIGGVGPHQMFLEFTDHNGPQAGVRGNSDGGFDFLISVENDSISPLKQFDLGISLNKIQCKDNLALIEKYDGSPACVYESSVIGLIIREWAKISEFEVTSGFFNHEIENARINSMQYVKHDCSSSIKIQIESIDKGDMVISVPRIIINSGLNDDEPDLFVLVDGHEVDFDETKDTKYRTLEIPLPQDSKKIEIITTCLI